MEELTKQIKRDLFDIKENINNPDKLMELFSFKKEEFEEIIHNLKFSVEDNLFEYKRTAVKLILEPLDSLQYDSRAMNSFDSQIGRARGLLSVTLIQRLITTGHIKIAGNKEEVSGTLTNDNADQPGIMEIIDFVKKEPLNNPAIQTDTLFKKIIMHIKMYKNETVKMNELLAKVPADKKVALKNNFNITLTEQIVKMREAYNEIIDRTVKNEQTPVSQNILLRYNFKPLGRFYLNQIEAFSSMLSTLKFASSEKFHTRELLLNLSHERGALLALIEREKTEYSSIIPFDNKGLETGRAFVKRISEFLGKERDWLKIHPGK
jgi:hypothetical protein